MLNFQTSVFILSLIYIETVVRRAVSGDLSKVLYIGYFALFTAIGFFYWLIHGFPAALGTDYQRTLELVFIFCVLFMVADSTQYNLETLKPDLGLMAVTCLLTLPLFIAAKVGYEMISGAIPADFSADLFPGRHNVIVWINPNHADDVFLLLAIASLLLGAVAWIYRKGNIFWPVFAVILAAAMLFLFRTTKSDSSFLALGVATGWLALTIAYERCLSPGRCRFSFLIAGFTLGIAGLLIVVFFEPFGILTKLSGFLENGLDAIDTDGVERSVDSRILLYSIALKLWQFAPFFGHGVHDPNIFASQYPDVDMRIASRYAHVHSLYLDILLRGGVFLLLVYAAVFYKTTQLLLGGFSSSKGIVKLLFGLLLVFGIFLVIENLFDLTFIVSSHLKVNLMNFTVLVCVTLHVARKAEHNFATAIV